MPDYPFTQQQAQAAHDEWGCNCGPTALAFALQTSLEAVRPLIPGFEEKRYTSPSMMQAAVRNARRSYHQVRRPDRGSMFSEWLAVVRVQWTGPWTAPGANPKWAYRQTHWIATWTDRQIWLVFDCNGGIRPFDRWGEEIVPLILQSYDRADGGWFPTHVFRFAPVSNVPARPGDGALSPCNRGAVG